MKFIFITKLKKVINNKTIYYALITISYKRLKTRINIYK